MHAHWPAFLAALADREQPRAVFAALAEITGHTVGTTLFTAMTHDVATGMSRRVYSSNEAAYPAGGSKKMSLGKWSAQVIDRQQPFSSLTIEEIATVFPDWELIRSLGAGSNCNIPIVVAGEVIGTLNLLHETGWYTPARVEEAMALRPFGALAFLVASDIARVQP